MNSDQVIDNIKQIINESGHRFLDAELCESSLNILMDCTRESELVPLFMRIKSFIINSHCATVLQKRVNLWVIKYTLMN